MPLRLNLTHEIRSHARQRSRDPLRLGLYAIGAIILMCTAYYFLRAQQVAATVAKAQSLSSDWDALAVKQQAAAAEQDKLRAEMMERDHLIGRVEGRFYWAPVLSKIMESVPAEVQITRFDGAAPAVKTGARLCTVGITGVAAGTEPRAVAEALRQRLRTKFSTQFSDVTSTFKTLDDSPDAVTLGGRQLGTAAFAIQLTFTSATPPPATDGKATAALK